MKTAVILLVLLFGVSVQAQEAPPASARDYFNNGSATFIRENPEQALAIVNEGLSFYPDNEPLLKLKELLEQQDDQQNQDQNQDQDQEQEQNQDQQQDEQDSDENQDQENEPEDSEEDQDEQKEDESDPSDQEQNPQEEEAQESEDMSEDEANMVLDSLRQLEQAQREQLTKEMIRQQMRTMPPVEKDW